MDSIPQPVISVIVVSFDKAEMLQKCIETLLSQQDFHQVEVHIVSKLPDGDAEGYTRRVPNIYWHQVPTDMTVPKMRTVGLNNSKANLVAFLEDNCIVAQGWLTAVLRAHESEYPAIGGAIEPGKYSRGIDWGIFYCEYGRFLSPLSGIVSALPGNNVSYKRSAIDPYSIESGFYEVFFHLALQKSGTELFAADAMNVANNSSWNGTSWISSAFHHGRAYASQRFGSKYELKRFLYILLSPALPFVKSARTLREIASRRRSELPILKALPWIIIFHVAWSTGELAGYLAGPGRSLEKWA